MDQHYIEFTHGPNASFNIPVRGNVTCELEGFGSEVQSIEVDLAVSNACSWITMVSPSTLIFSESGAQNITLTFIIPPDVSNSTKNTITIYGYWTTEPWGGPVSGGSGDAVSDHINITVFRNTIPIQGDVIFGPEGPPRSFDERYRGPIMMILFFISFLITIIIIYYYKKIKN